MSMTRRTAGAASAGRRKRGRSSDSDTQVRWLIIGAIGFFIAIIALVIFMNVRNELPVAGEQMLESQGNLHIEVGTRSPMIYNSTPPASGLHYGGLADWGVHSEPVPYELLIHNLEDGGVIVYYQCADGCVETVDELKAILAPYISRGDHVVLAPNDPAWLDAQGTPYHKDMGAPIAVVAWQRVLKLDAVDTERINAFIQRYEGLDHHVAGTG